MRRPGMGNCRGGSAKVVRDAAHPRLGGLRTVRASPNSHSTMVKRVARVLAGSDPWMDWVNEAQDVIKAMREPTRGMLLAVRNMYYNPDTAVFGKRDKNNPDRHILRMARNDYRVMINAALKD